VITLHVSNESSPLWTFICSFMLVYLIIDIFFSFVNGETLIMRGTGYLNFDEFPIFFIFTVLVKFMVLLYCSFYLYQSFIHFKNNLTKLTRKKVTFKKKNLKKNKMGYRK
jgi:hypothetical protein